ncbi:hypothetical protein Sjap_018877 [Stephania japonica]|uniref:Sucrose transporter n=1 Tax=Stephania japonica TaxID=461633 RepID=A0AAP0I8Y3_9MAGN
MTNGSGSGSGSGGEALHHHHHDHDHDHGVVPLRRVFRVATIACGIQFGWALQLSLLTPYVQELGVSHAWASLVWLCGPLSGFLVQPLVGHASDRFGRRSPFIFSGAASIVLAVLAIGFSSDIGRALGDQRAAHRPRPRAVVVFVVGFWLLDLANNLTQGPCRALLADLTKSDRRRARVAYAYYSFFMGVGNVLGYATGSYSRWFTIFPFTLTSSCGVSCANLKSAFLLHIACLISTAFLSLSASQQVPLTQFQFQFQFRDEMNPSEQTFLCQLFGSFKYLSRSIWIILFVTALMWLGWMPFILFDTDWMGRDIYKGNPNQGQNYYLGVRMGALGLMLNSVVLGLASVLMDRLCKKWGSTLVWGLSNILTSLCFVTMVIISTLVKHIKFSVNDLPPNGIVISSLVTFTLLGFPLAVAYSIPYSMISCHAEQLGLGQGLSMGIMNLAIVLPQVVVSMGSGPLDALFGGGNSPAFAVGAIATFASGLLAILALPRSPPVERPRTDA